MTSYLVFVCNDFFPLFVDNPFCITLVIHRELIIELNCQFITFDDGIMELQANQCCSECCGVE